jgi:hypothetical protein
VTSEEAIAKLRVERHRLEGALNRFYSHDLTDDPIALEAEALDICIPIRVIVHHVPEKKSLAVLSHIASDFWDKPIHFRPLIAPPSRTLPSGIHTMTVAVPLNITLKVGGAGNRGGTTFTRYRGDNNPESRVPLRDWWLGVCWDSGNNRVSNKDIILALANKEGGAHVDDDMTAKYKAAKSQGRIAIGGKPVSDLVRLASLVGIAGDELLEYLRNNFPEIPESQPADIAR